MSRVIVITGPSGVGKGTLIARAREQLPELEFILRMDRNDVRLLHDARAGAAQVVTLFQLARGLVDRVGQLVRIDLGDRIE